MKKILLTALLLIGIASANTISAQQEQGKDKGDRIEALRIAFISQKLELTPEEAQKFWPVYNQFIADMKALRSNFGMGPGKPQLTAEQQLDFEQKKLDLKKKYKSQFEAVIGKDKVNTLYTLEDEFRQKLRELHDERMQKHGQGPPPGK